ncbi:MAG: caspase family protein [Pirellulales bacterium]
MFNTYSAIRRALALVACSLTLTTSLDSSLIGYCAETHDETTSATNCAIVVGVRNYDPDQFQVLTNAEAESTAIFELLLRAGYSESVSRLITNSSGAENAQQIPSRTNILRELEQACLQLAPNDKLVFAFGGYGVQATEGKFYLCPLDADLDDIETLIPIDRIYELIGKCRIEHKLIVIDAMHGNTLADSFSPGISGALKFQLPKLPRPPANTAVS